LIVILSNRLEEFRKIGRRLVVSPFLASSGARKGRKPSDTATRMRRAGGHREDDQD
jgi:hypothetical protein